MTFSVRKEFKNPPIKEAIFAIYFKEVVNAEQLNNFQNTDYVKKNYPIINPNFTLQVTNKGQINSNNTKPSFSTNHKQEGYTLQCGSACNKSIQVTPTHISYHNFNKYAGWDTMYNELKEIWAEFCKSVGNNNLSRVSVRYINQIALPYPFKKGFADYIKLLPQIPDGMNKRVNNFFLQINVPDSNNEMQGVITETVLPVGENLSILNFLIDLTVLKEGKLECNGTEMWDSFTKIREFKNELFFSCITEETEKLFN